MLSSYKRTVLIVDDDERFRLTIQSVVEAEGHETRLASCGLDALEIVRAEPLHLSILDVQMPDISGLETYRRILLVRTSLPCIFVTGALSEEVRDEALSAGAFSVLEKPVDVGVLRKAVHRAIGVA